MKKWLTTGLSLICVLALAYVYLFYQPQTSADLVVLPKVTDCQVNQTICSVNLDPQHAINFSIKPFNAKPMTKLLLEVGGQDIKSAIITIDGLNMTMPGFPVSLSAEKRDQFIGETALGLCSQGDMQWQANVTIHMAETTYLIPFIFTTTNQLTN